MSPNEGDSLSIVRWAIIRRGEQLIVPSEYCDTVCEASSQVLSYDTMATSCTSDSSLILQIVVGVVNCLLCTLTH